MKVFMLVAVCLAAAVSAEPEPYYGYAGLGYAGYGYAGLGYAGLGYAGLGLHQQNWPSVRAPGFESTCHGCRGKRSAEAEPEPYYGYAGYGLGHFGAYGAYAPYAYGLRAALPLAAPVALSAGPLATAAGPTGIAGHGTGTSYVARSPQGLRGKRSAEPYYGYGGLGYAGYGYAPFGYRGFAGIAGHPGVATSYSHRSPQGLGK